MKKVIILAVVGLLVGVGGGTGIAVVLRPGVAADSTAADSTSAHNDSTAVIPAAPESEHAASAAPADSAAADTVAAAVNEATKAPPVADTSSHTPAVAPVLVERVANDSVHRAQVKRIGRIFAAMSPREASKVLQQLDDSDVTIIVASLTEKQAAAILQAFPPERAAAISRGSLRAAQPGQRP